MSRYFDKIIGSGVVPVPATALQVMEHSGMRVGVMEGRGFVDCHWLDNDSLEVMELDAADAVLNRIDAVVMRLDYTEDVRDLTLEIKKGTPAQEPTAPTMERSEYVQEYCLATIYIGARVTEIKQMNITDTRANSNVCGWVVALIDTVDTSSLFLQWQDAYSTYYNVMTAAFEEWFNNKQNDFAAWFSELTTNLLVGAYIQEYKRGVNLTETVETLEVGIEAYDQNAGDLIEVLVNGFVLEYDKEYSVANGVIIFANSLTAGNDVTIIIRKSVLGTKYLVETDLV
jgi:hypothetical protein